ncbi:MAG: PIN domain-containing protein [Bacteroidota bacterium]
MIYSSRFNVILDANVIYPAPIRDLLLNLADLEVISPKWTEIIQEEWIRNLLSNRKDLTRSKLLRTVNLMNLAFPDAEVYNFEELIDELELPDPDDRHVLAAAIRCKADAIITFNTKDFPDKYVNQFNIEIYNPDKFLILLNRLSPQLVKKAFENQLDSLKNPPKTREELIETLVNCNVTSADKIFK